MELLRENLDARCVSPIWRESAVYRQSFLACLQDELRMPSHRWLTRLRIEHAKELLAQTRSPSLKWRPDRIQRPVRIHTDVSKGRRRQPGRGVRDHSR